MDWCSCPELRKKRFAAFKSTWLHPILILFHLHIVLLIKPKSGEPWECNRSDKLPLCRLSATIIKRHHRKLVAPFLQTADANGGVCTAPCHVGEGFVSIDEAAGVVHERPSGTYWGVSRTSASELIRSQTHHKILKVQFSSLRNVIH